jgi:hypothetical protein
VKDEMKGYADASTCELVPQRYESRMNAFSLSADSRTHYTREYPMYSPRDSIKTAEYLLKTAAFDRSSVFADEI